MAKISIYMHKNLLNNKIYIGQTNNPSFRWEFNGIHYKSSKYFYNAIQKYGWDNFEHIILKEVYTEEEANYWEEYYIKYFNTMDRKVGYNLKSGGLRNNHCSETKEKIKQSNKITWANKKINEPEYFIKFKKEHSKKVSKLIICLNTKKVFKNQLEAAKWCGLKSSSGISRVCLGERKTAGRDPKTKEKLAWKFYEKKEGLE